MKRVTHLACGLLVAAGLAMPAAATPLNLIGLYEFEDGDASDTSGTGNDGSVGAGISFVSDAVRGNVAAFASTGNDGIDTGIDVDFGVLPEVTFGGWFLHTEFTGISKTISTDDGSFDRTLGLDFRGSGPTNEVSAFTGTGVLGSDFLPTLGEWYFAAVAYDGNEVRLFVNGEQLATATDNTDGDTSSFQLHIGVNPGFNEDHIGLADDVFVFDSALDVDDIANIYNNGFGPAPVPLPAGLPLLVAGVAAFGLIRRKR